MTDKLKMATPTPTRKTETEDEKAEQNIRAHMREDALLLNHLPVKSVSAAPVEDKIRDRPNSLGICILFGQLKDSDKGEQVWILLTKPENGDSERAPEQRFNVFDRHGNPVRGLSADDAVRQTAIAPAFRCLKKEGVIEMLHLRAVIKYYFIVKRVNPPVPWRIDSHYIKALTAACNAARNHAESAERSKQRYQERETATAAVYQRRESTTLLRDTTTLTDKAKEAPAKAKAISQRASIPHASTQSPSSPDSSSLFIPESPRHTAPPKGFASQAPSPTSAPPRSASAVPRSTPSSAPVASTQKISPTAKHSRAFQSQMLPPPATPKPAPQNPMPNTHCFSIRQNGSKPHKENKPAPMPSPKTPTPTPTPASTPKPTAPNKGANTPLKDKPPNPHSPLTFISAYRQAEADSDTYAHELRSIKAQQDATAAEVAALHTRLAELDVKAKEMKDKYEQTTVTKKRLHDELSGAEKELLRFGAELAERKFKRPRASRTGAGSGGGGGDKADEVPLWVGSGSEKE
ncbi:hypothetical protein ACJBU6_01381 [Exserohilum turcicum]